jgi:outer membrane receptor for monomeric catechols
MKEMPVMARFPPSDGRLYVESGYAGDTIEIARGLQLIGGARFDQFDMPAVDQNTGILRHRIDDKICVSQHQCQLEGSAQYREYLQHRLLGVG